MVLEAFALQLFEKVCLFLIVAKICNGKTKCLATRSQNHYTFENGIVFTQGSQASQAKPSKPNKPNKPSQTKCAV